MRIIVILLLSSVAGWAQIPAGNVCSGGYFSGNQQCSTTQGRIYRVVVPANLPRNASIVVGLHSSQPASVYAANAMMSTTGWDSAGTAAGGFIAIFPEATVDGNGKKNWCIDFSVTPCRVDDVAFIRSLIVKYSKIYSTNPKRNYVAGFSFGADMAFKMARRASDLIAAAASVEGHEWVLSPGTTPSFPPIQPVSFLMLCGAHDTILPCAGGTAASGSVVPSSDNDFSFWVRRANLIDDTATNPIIRSSRLVLTHKLRVNPTTKVAVEFYGLPNGGHNWYRTSMTDPRQISWQPDVAKNSPAGTNTSVLVMKFFFSHPKP